MTAAALGTDDELERKRARGRAAWHRWRAKHPKPTTQAEREAAERDRQERERNRLKQRAWREQHRAQNRAQHRRAAHDIGPAIDPGDPFKDNLDRCDSRWRDLLAGRLFDDVRLKILAPVYQSTPEAACEIAR